MYSKYTGTTLSVSNAAAITSGNDAISAFIHDTDETANDKIAIVNSAQLYGTAASGIAADIFANVPDNFVATNTITITNSGQIGSSKSFTDYGIFSFIEKTGFVPLQILDNPASITGINNQYNSKNIYSHNTSQYVGTFITDVAKGGGYATSGITNSGNLTSQVGSGLVARATGSTGLNSVTGITGGGSGSATVVISNTGTLTALSVGGTMGLGIRGEAKSSTDYAASNAGAITPGKSLATVSIGNSGAITTGNATNSGDVGIEGVAGAYATGTNTAGGAAAAKGGVATAIVSISNAGNITTADFIGALGIGGFSTANANAYGNTATGGTGSATTSITNSGTLNTDGAGIVGNAKEYAEAFGNTSTPATGKSYSGTGGVAPATVSISNSGNMTSFYGVGGYAKAGAGAIGFVAKGGTATAITTVSNSGNLVTLFVRHLWLRGGVD